MYVKARCCPRGAWICATQRLPPSERCLPRSRKPRPALPEASYTFTLNSMQRTVFFFILPAGGNSPAYRLSWRPKYLFLARLDVWGLVALIQTVPLTTSRGRRAPATRTTLRFLSHNHSGTRRPLASCISLTTPPQTIVRRLQLYPRPLL